MEAFMHMATSSSSLSTVALKTKSGNTPHSVPKDLTY